MDSVLCLLIGGSLALAQSIGTIKTTNFDEVRMGDDPNAKVIELDLKKFKNANGHLILRPFPNRVRLELEASRLPYGTYTFTRSNSCAKVGSVSVDRYKAGWSELYRFKSDQAHLAIEKSLPKAKMDEFTGKALTLFKIGKDSYDFVDCKMVESGGGGANSTSSSSSGGGSGGDEAP